MKRIAILGSTGHIAKGLIDNLPEVYEFQLYSRSKDRPLGLFPYEDHDIVINCIGVKEKLWQEPFQIFKITETFDNMVLDYVQKHPETLYINFSSGAVFGSLYDEPAAPWIAMCPDSFYGISKMNSEAKHRSLEHLSIVDIRVFSYFSKHLHPDSLCLMSEILSCIKNGKELITSHQDFYRDYIHPKDLAQLVEKIIDLHSVNVAFDAYSLRPCSKFEMLDYFKDAYDLRYRIDKDFSETSPTGPKLNYYSNNTAASEIGYIPLFSSMDSIMAGAYHLAGAAYWEYKEKC